MARSRNWAFTLNNWNPWTVEVLGDVDCRYMLYGKEVAPTTGTPHLQGMVCFSEAKTMKSITKKIPGAHLEIAKDLTALVTYCKKEGDWTERGTPPATQAQKGQKGGDAQVERFAAAKTAAEEGRFDDIPADLATRFDATYHRMHDRKRKLEKLEHTEEQMLWYYGDSGTGKSRKAREDHPDAYLKMCNKWWDGYTGQDTVIIEDFDKSHSVLCHHLKIWGDRYPFPAEVKGGGHNIRPKLIIVTSNWSPREIWQLQPDLEPILRRYKVVHFPKNPFS